MAKRLLVLAVVVGGLFAGLAGCGGEDPLTAEQQTAYRELTAYIENPEAVLTRGQPYQQAATAAMRDNVRTLKDADLGDDVDAALDTIAANPHEIDNPDEPSDPDAGRRYDEAVATLRDAVDGRLD